VALLALQEAGNGIDAVTLTPATGGGDTVAAGARVGGWDLPVALIVRNGHTAVQTVTVTGHAARSVPANGGIAVIPVFTAGTGYGVVKSISYSGVTALTVGAVRLGPPP
jgi:hypothetical protein